MTAEGPLTSGSGVKVCSICGFGGTDGYTVNRLRKPCSPVQQATCKSIKDGVPIAIPQAQTSPPSEDKVYNPDDTP